MPATGRSAAMNRTRVRALLLVSVWGLVSGCSRRDDPTQASVLEPGASLPAELTQLDVETTGDGAPRIRGTFQKDGRVIRFFTRRGPRGSLLEVMAGANEFEIDACFVNERGHSLIVVAGGHENTMPECPGVTEGRAEAEGDGDVQGQQTAVAAMETLLRLPFRAQYRGEQRSLVGTLEFLRRPPALGAVIGATTGDPQPR